MRITLPLAAQDFLVAFWRLQLSATRRCQLALHGRRARQCLSCWRAGAQDHPHRARLGAGRRVSDSARRLALGSGRAQLGA